MRTSDKMMSPASLDEYIDWIISDRLALKEREYGSYRRLIHTLLNIPFEWSNPMDENLAGIGIDLRGDFEYETGLYLDGSSGILPVCSVFEMLVGMVYRCETNVMFDFRNGNDASRWWHIIMDNLGFSELTDVNWKVGDADYIREICEKFMHRIYKKNGEGGLFIIKDKKFDCRKESFWRIFMVYLDENFIRKV